MKVKHLYILLCIVGTILPYTQIIPWTAENGMNIPLLLREVVASRVAAMGWLDALGAALALFAFMLVDGERRRIPSRWLPLVATFVVGVSLGFPLYLLQRELRHEARISRPRHAPTETDT